MRLLQKLLEIFLPYTCILCSAPAKQKIDICYLCELELPSLYNPCHRCANPILATDPYDAAGTLCAFCLQNPALSFSSCYALCSYEPPITKLITELKFKHALKNARVLGELLAQKIKSVWYQNKPLPQVIFPVPLHSERLKERGFNQALELARPVAKLLDLPIDYISFERIKSTLPQSSLKSVDREINVKNAFALCARKTDQKIYNHVAVVDDVITTGHTVEEFCRVLYQIGIEKIDVWCCAKAILKTQAS